MQKKEIIKLIEKKICKIPHGVDRDIFHSLHSKDDKAVHQNIETNDLSKGSENLSVDTFKFICNKGWRGTNWDRGGVQYLLKAFAEEFTKEDKVELIIKLNPAYINPQIIQQSIDQLQLDPDRPLIQINCDIVPTKALNDLYNKADCYVCCTRSEAFNLPGLEAMSCGLPTVQTNFGGQTDYMTDKNSLLIDYDLSIIKEDIMYEGIQWAVPRLESIKQQLRWAYENQDKIKEMGKQAEEDSKGWTWDITAQKIIEILK